MDGQGTGATWDAVVSLGVFHLLQMVNHDLRREGGVKKWKTAWNCEV